MSALTDVKARPRAKSFRLPLRRMNPMVATATVVLVAIVLIAILAPLLFPEGAERVNLRARMLPPSGAHWLGTDEVGRDIVARLVWGARSSLMVGLVSVAVATVVGVLLGLVAGYFGGLADTIIMRAIDILMAFPLLILALILLALFGQSLVVIMLAVAIASIPQFARVTRGSVLAIRHNEYVDAIAGLGARSPRILLRHVLPNILAPVVVLTTVRVAAAITIEAALSFLGLGDPTAATWGNVVATGRPYLERAPWIATFGGLVITVTVLSLNIIGDYLRDRLDPRLRGVDK